MERQGCSMFMFSFRLSPKRVLLGALAFVIVFALGAFGLQALKGGERMASVTPVGESAAKTEKVKPKKVKAKTNEDRLAFIESYGWEVAPDPAEVLEVIIPEEFDDVYNEYNAIQKKQGYDLEGYAGKRCKRYSYVVSNHPQADCEVRINLLLHGDRLIGGDVCSTDADGFMHGFELTE